MTIMIIFFALYIIVALFLLGAGASATKSEELAIFFALFWPLTVWIALGAWVAYKFDGRAW